MKTILVVVVIALALIVQVGYTQTSPMYGLKNYTPSPIAENPYNPNWDWEYGDVLLDNIPHYWIYFQNKPNAVQEYAAIAPWYQTGAWGGLVDRKKEDGWILLTRNFGTPNRRLLDEDNPYFVLYNSNRAIMRVFILLENMTNNYNYSTMELKKYANGGKETGVLAHLAPVSYAIDKVSNTYNNTTSSVINTLAMKARWVYADFPLAFDKDLIPSENTEIPASLQFDIYGTNVDKINLETKGFGVQGDKKFIDAFMQKYNFDAPGFSLNGGNMPSLDVPFNLSHVEIKSTAINWDGMKSFFDNLKIDMNFGNISASNPFKGLFDGFGTTLSSLSAASPLSITGLDLGGLFKFFVGGGMKQQNVQQTPPTFISSHYSSTGTMTSTVKYATLTIPLPAARLNYQAPMLGNAVGLVRNDPVGILTLTKTPILYKKQFYIYVRTGERSYESYAMNEYEIAEIPQLTVNTSSGLELKNCMVTIVAPTYGGWYPGNWVISKANSVKDQKHLIDFESPIDANAAYMRSIPVPIQFSKGRNLQIHSSISPTEIKLKIKATLQRKDDPNAQPVVFIATYNVDVIDNNGSTEQPLPTIPPQNIKCIIPATGGVRVSWDRNLEKNIKHYIIERSVNGASYIQIGTTIDTVFTDAEVQKTVKQYQANRQNVSVNYRVKAFSEWTDYIWPQMTSVTYTQYSAYSDAITISGSIIRPFEKNSFSQIIPEKNYLSQNFPNPFNPSTTIYYGVKDEGIVTIKVFNALGQEITTLVNDKKEVGYHFAEWNATGLPSGMYFYKIQNGNYIETKRMVLTK